MQATGSQEEILAMYVFLMLQLYVLLGSKVFILSWDNTLLRIQLVLGTKNVYIGWGKDQVLAENICVGRHKHGRRDPEVTRFCHH